MTRFTRQFESCLATSLPGLLDFFDPGFHRLLRSLLAAFFASALDEARLLLALARRYRFTLITVCHDGMGAGRRSDQRSRSNKRSRAKKNDQWFSHKNTYPSVAVVEPVTRHWGSYEQSRINNLTSSKGLDEVPSFLFR
jgi:hypothetical protein